MAFRKLWYSALDDCGMESIPHLKVRALGVIAKAEDLEFLFAEAQRLREEQLALEDDAGDVGDEYWRSSIALHGILKAAACKSAPILLQKLKDGDSSTRLLSARLLDGVCSSDHTTEIEEILTKEIDAEVRGALERVLSQGLKKRAWWQIWKKV